MMMRLLVVLVAVAAAVAPAAAQIPKAKLMGVKLNEVEDGVSARVNIDTSCSSTLRRLNHARLGPRTTLDGRPRLALGPRRRGVGRIV